MYFMVFIYQVPEKQFPFGAHHSIGDTGNFVILWSTTFYYFQHTSAFMIHSFLKGSYQARSDDFLKIFLRIKRSGHRFIHII